MAIANQTTAQVYALSHALVNTERAVGRYYSESRNTQRAPEVDAELAALKVLVDAAVADATPTPG